VEDQIDGDDALGILPFACWFLTVRAAMSFTFDLSWLSLVPYCLKGILLSFVPIILSALVSLSPLSYPSSPSSAMFPGLSFLDQNVLKRL
jgi:hypothetical protein